MKKASHVPRTIRPSARLLVIGLLAAVLFVVMLVLCAPSFINAHPKADLKQAITNAYQIHLALLEFEQSYGTFPDDDTTPEVIKNTNATIPLGTRTSNDYFRQLFAAKICTDERIFYTKSPLTHYPDNQIDSTNALGKGECGFAYVISESQHPSTPILIFGLLPGKRIFDVKTSKGSYQTFALCKDGTVQSLPIDKSGRVWIHGKDLFDPTQPFWKGKAPVIKWPDI